MSLRILTFSALLIASFGFISCETLDKSPKPEREKLSSLPHNMPAAWEGQAGMPGMMGGQ
jgi:hypothetical protein